MLKTIAMISDTHSKHKKLEGKIPECDLLIHAGDLTHRGELDGVLDAYAWLNRQPAKHVVTIPGNHEKYMEKDLPRYLDEIKRVAPRVHVLINEGVQIEGVKIWGSPVTPAFLNWAWNKERGSEISKYWDAIPLDTQILITHGPPLGILDLIPDGTNVGCADLARVSLKLKALKLHVFGHIHYSHGLRLENGVTYVNAAICTEQYLALNPVTLIDFADEFEP